MSQLSLSVVIGTYNRIELLKQCLDALLDEIKVSDEIVVVDAGSTDNTREYLRDLPAVRVIWDEGLVGQAKSLNRVFRSLKSRYVCWLSDDNIVQAGMLDQAVSILEHDPKIGMVSLKVKDISGPYAGAEYVGGIWPTGVLNCNQGMLPVALVNRLGGFDERFRDYGVDSDLTTRVLLEGYKVVYTKRVAIHHLRDHDANSWVDSHGRKQKMEFARELYGQKFS
ncbi:MAG: glycosyltransferase, partial [Chloroflexota bacterium]